MPIHRQSLSRYLAAIVALALAVVAGYELFERAVETPEPPTASTADAPADVPVRSIQVVSSPDEGMTPELMEVLKHGLPIEGCDRKSRSSDTVESQDKFEQVTSEAVETLSQSGDPEYLLAAALIDFDRQDKTSSPLLERALELMPNHPVAHWHRLQHCRDESCDRNALADAAVAADPTNGMLWLEIASRHIQSGDWEQAEQALRRAIASPRFDTYFIEYSLLVERALTATTELDYSERLLFGHGVAAAVAIPRFGDISRACRSDENDTATWVSLCDELGRSMHEQSRELISTMIGWGYRKVAAERVGDDARVAFIEAQSDRTRERYSYRGIRAGTNALLENDPAILRSYVDEFVAHGELQAVDSLVEDAIRLRNDPTYDQCNFVMRRPSD
ncbi:MAG: hypothetical protein QNJ14_06490 [Woeseiaceae bacterium]|nr:hypothetical protein [Woeseiaceae bacterium]